MTIQPRAVLAQQLDDLQARLPDILDSGPVETQCQYVVARAAAILHHAGSGDREYVSDRLTWILAKLPPNEPTRAIYDVDNLPRHDTIVSRRRKPGQFFGEAFETG